MPDYFTAEDFEKSALPKGMKAEVYETIELAVLHGWTVMVTGNNSVSIIAPEERKKYHFSSNRRSTIPHTRIRKDIMKFADPDLARIAKAVAHTPPGSTAGHLLTDQLPSVLIGNADVVDARPQAEPKPTRRPRYVVTRTPMVAKARDGEGYDSPTTVERKWSDGTVDWECSFAGCNLGPEGRPWEATSRLSVSRHYSGAHSRGNGTAKPPPTYATDVPGAAVYNPQQRRVDALAAVLAGLMVDPTHVSPEDIARAALLWVHDQSRQGTDLAAEREPLTDADVLNRIRTLLDDGTMGRYQQQFDDLSQRVVAMEAERETLQATLEQAYVEARHQRERAEQVSETLRTFIELANELGNESDKEAV